MLVIRLTRVGKKNSPAYRIVVAEKEKAVKRKFIEIVGHYNPTRKPKEVVIHKDRALFWMDRGAQPSDTVRNLMVDLEVLPKDQKVNKKYAKVKPIEGEAEAPVTAAPAETTEAEESASVAEANAEEAVDAAEVETEVEAEAEETAE